MRPSLGGAASGRVYDGLLIVVVQGRALFEDLFDGVVGNHLLLEGVSTGFGRLNHLDDLGVGAAFTLLQRCYGFLCHGLLLLLLRVDDYLISL